jgi:hypothetical protein
MTRGGLHHCNQGAKALTDHNVAAQPGSYGPDDAIITLDWAYRPAAYVYWSATDGWELVSQHDAEYVRRPVGPPEMTPARAGRELARILAEQLRARVTELEHQVRRQAGELRQADRTLRGERLERAAFAMRATAALQRERALRALAEAGERTP